MDINALDEINGTHCSVLKYHIMSPFDFFLCVFWLHISVIWREWSSENWNIFHFLGVILCANVNALMTKSTLFVHTSSTLAPWPNQFLGGSGYFTGLKHLKFKWALKWLKQVQLFTIWVWVVGTACHPCQVQVLDECWFDNFGRISYNILSKN